MAGMFPLRTIAVISILIGAHTRASAQTKLYYSDSIENSIRRMDIDGTNIEDVVTEADSPFGVQVDGAAGKIYWYSLSFNAICRANSDGSDVEQIISGVSSSFYFALDVPGQKIYWIHNAEFRRANTDGTNNEMVNSDLGIQGGSHGVAIDSAGEQFYFADQGSNNIMRVNLDGTGITTLIGREDDDPWGVALDLLNGQIYWADLTTPGGRVFKANLDGSNIVEIATDLFSATAVAVDPANGKVFWSEAQGGNTIVRTLKRANLDGSGVEVLLPSSLVVGLHVSSASVPAIPGVSAWGTLLLLMGILVCATIVIRRRGKTALYRLCK